MKTTGKFLLAFAMMLGLGFAPAGSAAASSSASSSAGIKQLVSRAATMECSGLGTISLERRGTFGPAGWVREMGRRSDGYVGFKVYHPSGRWDQYRITFGYTNGTSHTEQQHAPSLCYSTYSLSHVRWVQFAARNGGAWHESSKWWF